MATFSLTEKSSGVFDCNLELLWIRTVEHRGVQNLLLILGYMCTCSEKEGEITRILRHFLPSSHEGGMGSHSVRATVAKKSHHYCYLKTNIRKPRHSKMERGELTHFHGVQLLSIPVCLSGSGGAADSL